MVVPFRKIDDALVNSHRFNQELDARLKDPRLYHPHNLADMIAKQWQLYKKDTYTHGYVLIENNTFIAAMLGSIRELAWHQPARAIFPSRFVKLTAIASQHFQSSTFAQLSERLLMHSLFESCENSHITFPSVRTDLIAAFTKLGWLEWMYLAEKTLSEKLPYTNTQINFRFAKREDLSIAVKLWRQMVQFHHQVDVRTDQRLNIDDLSALQKEIWQNSDKQALILAELDGKIVGIIHGTITNDGYDPTLSITIPEKMGYVSCISVEQSLLQKGIGTSLWIAMQNWFVENKMSKIHLQYCHLNKNSTQFWTRMGFKPLAVTLHKYLHQRSHSKGI